jgi:hypothetical protein
MDPDWVRKCQEGFLGRQEAEEARKVKRKG